MIARVAGPALACLLLAGCGQTLATDASEATLAYGIAKGVAAQAEAANPGLMPVVQAVEAKADPIAAVVSAGTAPALASLAQDLLVATASAVHVLPNAPVAAQP